MQVAEILQFGRLAQFVPLPQSQPLEQRVEAFALSETITFRVAILEGNAPLARLLATGIAAESTRVQVYADLASAMQQMEGEAPDLLLLDLDLEGVDGLALVATLRSRYPSMRLLMLSGQADVGRVVEALNRGGDDYLAKPFSLLEMMARVRALVRRSGGVMPASPSAAERLVLHREQSRVSCQGHSVDLTPRECELLEFLMAHSGTTLSRATLSQQVWNMPAEANTNIVDVYVKYLRDKLETAYQQKLIRTVRGVGYVFQYQS